MRTSLLAGVAAVALMPMAALAADMPDYVYAGIPTAERHNVTKVGDDTVRLGINYMFTPGR
jgi:hypothetical protein